MNSLLTTNRLTVALLSTVAALFVIIAGETYLANREPSVDPGTVNDDDMALPTLADNRYVAPQIEDFPEVLGRPLFFRDRKLPPEPEPEVVAAAPLLPLRLKLEGVAISSDSRVAVLRNTGNNQLLQLAEGMSHDGWLLETVSADRAIFTRGAQRTELLLDAAN